MSKLIEEGIDNGAIRRQPVRPLSHLITGAVDEAALYIANSPDPQSARVEIAESLSLLSESIAGPTPLPRAQEQAD